MKTGFLFLTSLIFLSSFAGVCSAAYIQWDGGAGTSNWTDAANWNGDVIPGTADKAGFKTATGAVVSTTVPTFMDMTLGGNGGLGILTVQPGAALTCTNTWSMGQSSNEAGVLNISGGTITVGNWYYVGNAGAGTVNISGGSITISALLSIANGAAPASIGTVNLDGGTITCGTFSMATVGGTARLNITGGRLIINGDVTSTIATYITNTWIKGYGSTSNVRYDYNVTTLGKTTVWAVGATKAANPSPENSATNVARDATLSWVAGTGAASHDVYFGTASPGTFQINQTGTAFNPGQLEFDTKYYWRIDEVNGPNTVTGDVWSFTTVSGQAKNPDPANSAVNIAFDKILRWTAGPGAASHDVYFGTVFSDVNNANRLLGDLNGDGIVDRNDMLLLAEYWLLDPAGTEPYAAVNTDNVVDFIDYALLAQDWMNSAGAVFKGNQDTNSFNPGTLAFNTSYYWRIDEVNGPDTVRGNIWSFSTQSGKAYNPNPANSASNVALNATLSWTAGPGVVSHDVYFGTANPPPSIGNQTATTYSPTLAANTTYYWRIDEVGGSGTITGDLWSFTTQSGKAYNPSPANSASNVATNATLSWTAGAGATSHDVYFGTANPPPSIDNRTTTTYNPGTLANSTTYYWRIDEVGGLGTITGDLWSFTTVPLSTTPVYPYLSWRNDPTNSVVVNWWNPSATGDSSVDYGLTNSYGSTATVATVTNFHHVELTGLNPSTQYHYRVRSSDGTIGSDMTFTTADAVADANTFSFSFAVYGDPRGGQSANEPYYTRHQALCNWILAQNYDFALETGDTVWAGGITTQHPLEPQEFWTDFYRLESNLSKSKVIMATMGNHEVQPTGSGETVTYIYYYDLYTGAFPINGTSGNTGRVYSFDYGNAHFVCLSSYQINVPTTQATWLAADLAAARANPNIKWIFAFMHAPMYTTNTSRGNRTDCIDAWGPLFDTYHVDIVFSGHNHLLERSRSIKAGAAVDDGVGTVYVTTGLGGASFDPPGSGSPGLFVYTYNSQTLATCVTIDGNNLTVNSITNVDGTVRDTFTLSK